MSLNNIVIVPAGSSPIPRLSGSPARLATIGTGGNGHGYHHVRVVSATAEDTMGLADRAQAVVLAHETGLICPNEASSRHS
jgi:hypothetical protein